MKKWLNTICCMMLIICLSNELLAYELATHAFLTNSAFQRSRLGTDLSLIQNLGIDLFTRNPFTQDVPFGASYYDVQGATVTTRFAANPQNGLDFEGRIMGSILLDADALKLNGWLMRGVIREDDTPRDQSRERYNSDPYASRTRVLNHFYDPIFDRALTFVVSLGEKSPDWAVGTRDIFADPNRPNDSRGNHFSMFDAREAMYRALTGIRRGDDPARTMPFNETERRSWWATTFRSLGDLVHLIQDMAQPQHTRNERHGGETYTGGGLLGHRSVYERYIEDRATRAFFRIPDSTPGGRLVETEPLLPDMSYPIPRFNGYLPYFTTRNIHAGVLIRLGLADFSNRSFFTAAKNYGDREYAFPQGITGPLEPATITTFAGAMFQAQVRKADLPDFVQGSSEMGVIVTTAAGQWDAFLPQGGTYRLTRTNYDEMARVLLPRAIAYSAGIVDYFFRGQMEISLPEDGVYSVVDHANFGGDSPTDPVNGFKGFRKLRLKLKNTTPDIQDPDGRVFTQDMMNGAVIAVLKFHRNLCYRDDLEGEPGAPGIDPLECRSPEEEIVLSDRVPNISLRPNGDPVTIPFTFQRELPINATDVYLQVVYRGRLGAEEDAVVVATKDISEPTYFTYYNATDYIHIGPRVYTRMQVNQSQALLDRVFPQSCVEGERPNRRLRAGCLETLQLDLDLAFASLADPTVWIRRLPARRFLRFAFLTDGGPAPSDAGQTAGAALQSLQVRTAFGDENGLEDVIRQRGTCLPLNPFEVRPAQNQLYMDPFVYSATLLSPIRGVYSWMGGSCVVNGDGSVPGTPDDRNEAMGPLTPDERRPYPVLIHASFR